MLTLLPVLATLAIASNASKSNENKGKNANSGKGKANGKAKAPKEAQCLPRPPVVFNPAQMNFKDTDGTQTFTISLSKAPAGPVVYNLGAPNMKFDKCSVTFNPTNWNVPQTIRTIPTIFKGNDQEMKFEITATGNAHKHDMKILPVTRFAMDAAVGKSAGDPHFTLFSGKVISQQKQAINYLFKSPEFDVMTAQEKCIPTSKGYCNHAVVIRFGNSWYTYDARNVSKSGDGIVVSFDGDENSAFTYSPPSKAKKTYDFEIPDGSKVTVFPSAYSEKFGIHNSVTVSLHPSTAVKGKGALNDPFADDNTLILSNGSSIALTTKADVFFNSWEVPESENFLSGNIPRYTPASMPEFEVCSPGAKAPKAKHNLKNYHGGWKKVVDEKVKAVEYSPAQIESATNTCNSVFSDLEFCQDILSSQAYEETCVRDVLLANGTVIAQDHLEDYLLECADNVKSLAEVDAEIDKVMEKFGFGSIACPKNCSNNGECTEGGCICNTGFHGVSCANAN